MRRLLVVLAGVAVAACVHDGRALTAPAPGATLPPEPITTLTTQPGAVIGTVGPLVLTSPAFLEGAALIDRFTCFGAGISPPLQWSGVPADTVELAITVIDVDEEVLHWVVSGLDAALVGLGDGTTPEGAVEAVNDTGATGWYAPCNDPNGDPHHYVFTVYTLNAASGIAADTDALDAYAAIKRLATNEASVTGVYPAPTS